MRRRSQVWRRLLPELLSLPRLISGLAPADPLSPKSRVCSMQRGFCTLGQVSAGWLQSEPCLLAELDEAGDTHALVAGLPADPLGFIPRKIHLRTGALGGAIAKTDMALPTERAGEDVVLGEVVEVGVDDLGYALSPPRKHGKTTFRLRPADVPEALEAPTAERDQGAASMHWGLF